jgi:hypothetical protein
MFTIQELRCIVAQNQPAGIFNRREIKAATSSVEG